MRGPAYRPTLGGLAKRARHGSHRLHRIPRGPSAHRARRRGDARRARRLARHRDRRSMRRALKGVSRVFHCAGVTSVRPADAELLFDVNVRGTKLVMEESLRAGVERVVYTSSAAAIGPASDGKAATETQLFTAARLGIPYVNSVHEAEVEAMRVA